MAFGIGVSLGWLGCFLMAFMAGKKIDADVRKMMEQNPIRATED